MNRLPEEATCKNCPHWYRIKDALGECNVIDIHTLEDFGCSRHPYWGKEEMGREPIEMDERCGDASCRMYSKCMYNGQCYTG